MNLPKKLQASPYLNVQGQTVENQIDCKRYKFNPGVIELLKDSKIAKDSDYLVREHNIDVVDLSKLVELELLVSPEKLWKRTFIQNVEIETSAHCNWRCITSDFNSILRSEYSR